LAAWIKSHPYLRQDRLHITIILTRFVVIIDIIIYVG